MQKITAKEVAIITRDARLKRKAVMTKAKRKAAAQKKKYEWFLESPACPKCQEDLPDLAVIKRFNKTLEEENTGIREAYKRMHVFNKKLNQSN